MPDNHKKRRFFTLKNKRHMPTWLAKIIAFLFKVISLTYRLDYSNAKWWLDTISPSPAVFTLWHNRILFFAPLIPRNILEKCTVLISASRDGEYISTFIKYFGLNVARGSSSRGGFHALVELNNAINSGNSVILTVDGPRGPRYTIHPGAAMLAQKNQIPVIPLSLNAKHYWQAKSWDGTQIPVPFSSVKMVFGKPVMISPDASQEEAAELIRASLMEITVD